MSEILNKLTYGEIKQLLEIFGNKPKESNSDSPFKIGQIYYIRTVTMHHVGRLKAIYHDFLVLEEASWVADSGRFNEFITKGNVSSSCEIEPFYNDAIIGRGSIIDATIWNNKLPTEVK
jgi:hypothetical protein